MFALPTNSNSIFIPTIQTGCLKAEFDSTYPVHLQGIINPEEFQQSIQKINRAISSSAWMMIVGLLFAGCIIGGMICFIVGGIQGTRSREFGFHALIGVGIGLTSFGSIVFSVGCCVIQTQRSARMRQAISQESMKYSARSPIPCSWRLNMTRGLIGSAYIHSHHNQVIYQIVIDVGRANASESGTAVYYSNTVSSTAPTVFIGQPPCYMPSPPPPPPYSVDTIETCLKCGLVRQDLTAKFCSSCGEAFEKF
ncbi:unnamed protein product [Adineta ricciae]|uniref:Uncharacterized protein n=1 Tax=Adineta ricciae TaxID=249248 RepID=A0A814FL55_ADIRI|nr:unnamed protein product [Adineta ricciae]CAF1029001.1 unnamed protein product [Adineta ricciae]